MMENAGRHLADLDPSTGRVGNPCMVADATLTLALPKAGLGLAPQVAGALFAADICVPPSVYETIGLHLSSPFAAGHGSPGRCA